MPDRTSGVMRKIDALLFLRHGVGSRFRCIGTGGDWTDGNTGILAIPGEYLFQWHQQGCYWPLWTIDIL